MRVNITNAESLAFTVESVQFNPNSSGFDSAFFDVNSTDDLERRLGAYFVFNCAQNATAVDMRYLASEFAYQINRKDFDSLAYFSRFIDGGECKRLGIEIHLNLINRQELRITVSSD